MSEVTIYFYAEVSRRTVAELIQAVETAYRHFLSQEGKDERLSLFLSIASHGGETDAAIHAFHYLRGLSDRVRLTTINMGTVDSAAVVIYAAGTKRLCVAEGKFLIHSPKISLGGEYFLNDLHACYAWARQVLETDTARMLQILSRVTTWDAATAMQKMENQTIVDAKMAAEIGLATEVVSYAPLPEPPQAIIVGSPQS